VILNKQKCLFPKTADRKVKQALSGNWSQWERGGDKERVKEEEYVEIFCTHLRKLKMRPVETILRMGGGIKDHDGGGELN
jgi:hypothetical protein